MDQAVGTLAQWRGLPRERRWEREGVFAADGEADAIKSPQAPSSACHQRVVEADVTAQSICLRRRHLSDSHERQRL